MYGSFYVFRHYIAILREWHGAHAHHVTRHNMPIHNILSTAPQLSIYQKALGTLPEDNKFVLGILIFKGLTARRLYKSFGVKGLK
jgi:hypothetical protein